jgi:hypothetical protein
MIYNGFNIFLAMKVKEDETHMKLLIEKIKNYMEIQVKKEKVKKTAKLLIKVAKKKLLNRFN